MRQKQILDSFLSKWRVLFPNEVCLQARASAADFASESRSLLNESSTRKKEWDAEPSYRVPDLLVELEYGQETVPFVVEVVASAHKAHLREHIDQAKQYADVLNANPLILAEYLSEGLRQFCEENGVNYADLTGNLSIKTDRVLIQLFQQRNRGAHAKEDALNLFSDKASLIIRRLFFNESFAKIQELSEDLGVSPGWVSKVANRLHAANYVEKEWGRGVRLVNAKDLLDDWVRQYDYRKNRFSPYYCHAKSIDEVLDRLRSLDSDLLSSCALSYGSGAYLKEPYAAVYQAHLYIRSPKERLVQALDLEEDEAGANLFLVEPYYHESAFYEVEEKDGLPVVSDLQLYLDLYNFPQRGREQAERIFEKRILPRLLNSSEQQRPEEVG